MKILTASDRFNIPGLAALLKSIELNASENLNQTVEITVVYSGIDASEKKRLEACCYYPIQWKEFQPIEGVVSMFGSRMSYVKMQPDKYTDATDRLIWLDSDTIVRGSLEPLWNMDLEGTVLAGARNPWGNPNNQPDKSSYLNTGVMVYDMKAWLEEKLSAKLLKNVQVNLWGDHEQGAFNSVLLGRWKELHRRWNNHITEDLSSQVMHFMSRPKPWENPAPNELWLQMFQQTPFKNELNQLSQRPQWLSKSRLLYKLQSWQKEPWIRLQSYLKNRKRLQESSQNNNGDVPSAAKTTARSPHLCDKPKSQNQLFRVTSLQIR
jgi:lipopolysaccharide biosynthesis glycosyltransferase